METLNSTSIDIDLANIRDEIKLLLLRIKSMAVHKDMLLKQLNDVTELGQILNEELNKLFDRQEKLIKEKEVQAHQFIEESHDRTKRKESLCSDDSLLSETNNEEADNVDLTEMKEGDCPRCSFCLLTFDNNDKLLEHTCVEYYLNSGLSFVSLTSKMIKDVTPAAIVPDNIIQNGQAPLRRYICSICGIFCKTKRSLDRHKKNQVCKQKYKQKYGCPVCRFSCSLRHNLLRHMRNRGCEQKYMSSGLKTGSISLDEFKFIVPDTVVADKPVQNIKSYLRMYSCRVCRFFCSRKNNLVRHMKNMGCEEKYKSSGLKYTFLPIDVFKMIPPESVVANDPAQNLESKLRMYSCPVCHFSCSAKFNLLRHMRNKGCEEKYMFTKLKDASESLIELSTVLNDGSQDPLKEFSSQLSVSDTLKVSTDARVETILIDYTVQNFKFKLPRYSCPVCHEHCSTKFDLLSHIRNKVCALKKGANKKEKSVVGSADYSKLQHIFSVQPNANIFTCCICRKSTDNDTSEGRRRETGKDICVTCEERFPEFSLSRSNEDETVEKLLKCKICNRSFSDRSLLLKHMRVHSAERLHMCTRCGKSYLNSAGLNYHMKKHDSGNLLNVKFVRKR